MLVCLRFFSFLSSFWISFSRPSVSGEGGDQFIGHRIALHMGARQGVTGQPLHELCGQFRDFKSFLSV